MSGPSRGLLITATLALFVVWSSSFIAMSYLLGSEAEPARLTPLGLTVVRMLSAAAPIAAYLVVRRRRETFAALGRWPMRLVLCGALGVPAYNLSLYSALARGLPAPVASVITTLVPLLVIVLAAWFLGERITPRRGIGVVIGMAGVIVIAMSRQQVGVSYPLIVGTAMLAPLSWSVYTVVSKRTFATHTATEPKISTLVWTYAGIVLGAVLLLPWVPAVIEEIAALDTTGWAAVLYLAIPCTVFGFAVWTWLLQHLPASTVGLTVFLNPPLTLLAKLMLTWLLPQVFLFHLLSRELIGGLVVLTGLAVALVAPRGRVRE